MLRAIVHCISVTIVSCGAGGGPVGGVEIEEEAGAGGFQDTWADLESSQQLYQRYAFHCACELCQRKQTHLLPRA